MSLAVGRRAANPDRPLGGDVGPRGSSPSGCHGRAGRETSRRRLAVPAHRRPDPLVRLRAGHADLLAVVDERHAGHRSAAASRPPSRLDVAAELGHEARSWSWLVRNVAKPARRVRRRATPSARPRAIRRRRSETPSDRRAASPKSKVRSSAPSRHVGRRRSTSRRRPRRGEAHRDGAPGSGRGSPPARRGCRRCSRAARPSSMRCLMASSRKPSTPRSSSQKSAIASSSAVTAGFARLRSGMPSQK